MRRIMREQPWATLGIVVGAIVAALICLPLFAPQQDTPDTTSFRVLSGPPQAQARMLPTGERLEVIGDEDLYLTSTSAVKQLASSVSPQAVQVDFYWNGEIFRWKSYSTVTNTSGAKIDPDVTTGIIGFDAGLIENLTLVLDEDAASTGTSIYAVYWGRG